MSRKHGKDTSKQLATGLTSADKNIQLFKSKAKLGTDISVEECWQLHDQIAKRNKNDKRTYSRRIKGYSALLDYIFVWEANNDITDIEPTNILDLYLESDDTDNDNYELDKAERIVIKIAAFKDILKITNTNLHNNSITPNMLAQLTSSLNQILTDFADDNQLATLFMPYQDPTEELEILCCQLLEKTDKKGLKRQRTYASHHAARFETEKGKITLLNFALNFGAKFHELNNMLPCDILDAVLPKLSNAIEPNPLDDKYTAKQRWDTRQKLMFYFKGEFEKILPKEQWVRIDDGEEVEEASADDIKYHTDWHEAQFISKNIQIETPTEKQIKENETGDYSDYTAVRYHSSKNADYNKFWQEEVFRTIPRHLPAELAPEKVAETKEYFKNFLMN
jgi:hypothetical protein